MYWDEYSPVSCRAAESEKVTAAGGGATSGGGAGGGGGVGEGGGSEGEGGEGEGEGGGPCSSLRRGELGQLPSPPPSLRGRRSAERSDGGSGAALLVGLEGLEGFVGGFEGLEGFVGGFEGLEGFVGGFEGL